MSRGRGCGKRGLYQHRGCCETTAHAEKNNFCSTIVLVGSDFMLWDLKALSWGCPVGLLCRTVKYSLSSCCSLTLINKLEVFGASAVAQDSGLHCGRGQHQGHSGAAASEPSHCFWRHVQLPFLHIRHSSGCLALKSTLTICITRKTQHEPYFLSLSPAFCEVFVSYSWAGILDKRWEKICVFLQLYQSLM